MVVVEAKNGFGEHTADLAPGAFVTIFKVSMPNKQSIYGS